MKKTSTLVALIASGALIAGCGGGDTTTVTVSDSGTTVDPIDQAPDQRPETETTEDNEVITNAKVGGPSKTDGNLSIRVDKLEVIPRAIPAHEHWTSKTIEPTEGAKLVVATVTAKNDGKQSVHPFCGRQGNSLSDTDERIFESDDRSIGLPGNTLCEDIQPGFKSTMKILYQVPMDAKVVRVTLWDADDPEDPRGDSRIRFYR